MRQALFPVGELLQQSGKNKINIAWFDVSKKSLTWVKTATQFLDQK